MTGVCWCFYCTRVIGTSCYTPTFCTAVYLSCVIPECISCTLASHQTQIFITHLKQIQNHEFSFWACYRSSRRQRWCAVITVHFASDHMLARVERTAGQMDVTVEWRIAQERLWNTFFQPYWERKHTEGSLRANLEDHGGPEKQMMAVRPARGCELMVRMKDNCFLSLPAAGVCYCRCYSRTAALIIYTFWAVFTVPVLFYWPSNFAYTIFRAAVSAIRRCHHFTDIAINITINCVKLYHHDMKADSKCINSRCDLPAKHMTNIILPYARLWSDRWTFDIRNRIYGKFSSSPVKAENFVSGVLQWYN